MNQLESRYPPEELLGHTAWMESLARRLLSDTQAAEDVVQETWLAFLHRPPRDHRASRTWLGRVVRNLALRSRRARARRAARERRAARLERCTITPAQMLEQAEMHRLLVDEVLHLEEPYRSTVLLRFFGEQSAAEIALLEGVPLDTVKTRLRRAIEMLRERLDRIQGSRESWMASLAPLAGPGFLPGGPAGAPAPEVVAAGAGTGAGPSAGLSMTGTTLGGIIVAQKAIVGVGLIGAVALAVGYGVGQLASRPSMEDARSRLALVESRKLEDSQARISGLTRELEEARLAAAGLRAEKEKLAAKVKALGEDLEAAARKPQSVKAAKGQKPAFTFGKYGDLEGLNEADWAEMAEAAHQIGDLFAGLSESWELGQPEDPEFNAKVSAQNAKLIKPYLNFIGKISTNGSGMNGEFSHPLILANLMSAMLTGSEVPLDAAQKQEVTRLGKDYENRYEKLQSGYDPSTPRLEKFMDELELKQEVMKGMKGLLSAEQSASVARPAISDTMGDVTSPMMMASPHCKGLEVPSWEALRTAIAKQVGDKYELPASQVEALGPAFDAWMAEIRPHFPPGKEKEFLRLEHAAIAGRAQVNLYHRILALPELSEKVRQMVLAGQSWWVPHVIEPPAQG